MKLAAAILLALIPGCTAPAHATISGGDLLVSDFFRWPDWRENLARFDCTPEMNVFMWTLPPVDDDSPPSVIVENDLPLFVVDPPLLVIDTPWTPLPPSAVPEPSTWAMMAIGAAAMLWRSRKAIA